MRLTFYGVRGSYPSARRDQVRYGGNTTCLYFVSRSGQHLILDGGSGIKLLGHDLLQQEFGQGQGEATILALQANVNTAVLLHHSPDHDDEMLNQTGQEAAEIAADTSTQVLMARDGLILDVRKY